jgi:hypothetical protein
MALGARREVEIEDVVGLRVNALEPIEVLAPVLDQGIEREFAVTLGSAPGDDQAAQRGEVPPDLAHHVGVAVVAEGFRHHRVVRLAEAQQRTHLPLAEHQMERLDHSPHPGEGDLQEAHLRPVGQLDAHQIAGLDTRAEEPGGQGVRGLLELAERIATLLGDERHPVRRLVDGLVEEIVKRPLAPETCGHPALPVGV